MPLPDVFSYATLNVMYFSYSASWKLLCTTVRVMALRSSASRASSFALASAASRSCFFDSTSLSAASFFSSTKSSPTVFPSIFRSSPPNAFLTPSDICTTMRRPTSSTVNPFMFLMSFRKVSRFFSVICTCRGSLPHPTKVSTVVPNNTAINKPFMFCCSFNPKCIPCSISRRQQFRNAPGVIRKARRHCRRDLQCRICRMNPAEIVVCKVKCIRSLKILPFLREKVRQSGHPTHLHSDGQVLPFNMRCADLFFIRNCRPRPVGQPPQRLVENTGALLHAKWRKISSVGHNRPDHANG